MNFPSKGDFFEMFGLTPENEDSNMAYCQYLKRSIDGFQELDISFSAVAESFQVILRFGGIDVVTLSSENVRSISLIQDGAESGIHVAFDAVNATSEALVVLDPHFHCHWWTLRSN